MLAISATVGLHYSALGKESAPGHTLENHELVIMADS